MFLTVLIFIFFFSIVFSISLFCLVKKDLILENYHLIIPAICIGIWAVYALNHNPFYFDSYILYSAGKTILTNPRDLYKVPTYHQLPSFAIFVAFTLSFLPYSIAYNVLLIYNYIWGILSNREINKILISMDVKQKMHRFMFLMIISNGFFVYNQFWFNNTKYLLMLSLLFIIRREVQFNKKGEEKDFKYYLINYILSAFVIGLAPHFIFYSIIYLFHDIPHNEIFKQENIRKYGLFIIICVIQNFFFIIYPFQILDLLHGFTVVPRQRQKLKVLYLRDWINTSIENARFLNSLSVIFTSIIAIYLTMNNKLQIQEKFGYFSITYILIGFQFYHTVTSLVFFSLVLLLYPQFLDQDKKGIEFIKNNKFLLIGIFSILGIFFIAHEFILYEFIIPIPTEFPLDIIDNLRWIFLLSTMMISLILLKLEVKKVKGDKEVQN